MLVTDARLRRLSAVHFAEALCIINHAAKRVKGKRIHTVGVCSKYLISATSLNARTALRPKIVVFVIVVLVKKPLYSVFLSKYHIPQFFHVLKIKALTQSCHPCVFAGNKILKSRIRIANAIADCASAEWNPKRFCKRLSVSKRRVVACRVCHCRVVVVDGAHYRRKTLLLQVFCNKKSARS